MFDRVEPLSLRLAYARERLMLEDLQQRASIEDSPYRADLEAHPDAIDVPLAQIEAGRIFVAELGTTVVGFVAIIPHNDGTGELDGLFVEPAHWRKGIGSALVATAEDALRRLGIGTMTVVANPKAEKFYENSGFVVEGIAETRFGPAYKMTRELR